MAAPQGEVPFDPIPPAFEGEQVLNVTHTAFMKSLRGFEGVLQLED